MKKKFMALVLPFMMMTTLTGCNNDGQYNKFCEAAADAAPLLLNSLTGKEIYASEKVRTLSDYNSVLALTTFTFQEKELAIDWEFSPADKWVAAPYAVDETRNKIMPAYGKEAFDAGLKCSVSVLEKGKKHGKVSLSWSFHVEATDVEEMTLKDINETFVKNDYALGTMAKDAEGKDVSIGTRGYITATYEAPNDVYSGVYISDGEYSMQLYAGSLSSLWTENQLKVGDCVFAVGKLSIYNGAMELAPTLLEVIHGDTYNIAPAATIDLSTKTFDKSIKVNSSTLATFPECVYVGGNVSSDSAHAEVNFKHGDTDVKVYVNYHIGKTAMNAVKELISGYTANETTVTIKGILTFYIDTPQIIPIFGVDSFIAPQAA